MKSHPLFNTHAQDWQLIQIRPNNKKVILSMMSHINQLDLEYAK